MRQAPDSLWLPQSFDVLNQRCLWTPDVLEMGGWLCGSDALETQVRAWLGTHQLTSGDSSRDG